MPNPLACARASQPARRLSVPIMAIVWAVQCAPTPASCRTISWSGRPPGPRLGVGSTVTYVGADYRVVGAAVARAGDSFEFRPGLTIQYSIGGGDVRLVFADPI